MALICNSIPKSGTYLLAAIAECLGYQDCLARFVDSGTTIVNDQNHEIRFENGSDAERFKRLAKGQYSPSHLTYSNAMACSSSTSRRRGAPRALQAGSRVRHGSGTIYQPDIQRMLEPSSGGTALAALHSL